MTRFRNSPGQRDGRWRLGVCLSCGLGLLLGLGAVLAAGASAWLGGGLGLAGLVLFAVGGGLLVAHLVLDQPRNPRVR
jgi:hypothetical protein